MKNDIQANTELSAGSSSVTHTPTPYTVGGEPLYYVKGQRIHKAPLHTDVPGGTNISLGFPVCEASEYVDPQIIADIFLKNEKWPALLELLEDVDGFLHDLKLFPEDRSYPSNLAARIDSLLKEARS